MATENIPQIDRAIKEWGVAFRKAMKEANKAIEDVKMNGENLKARKNQCYIMRP